ncbi:SH3 domain-containing protein [Paeniclostridium sordellii]|uniref:SH3 domain-containing protein n=1 Tax=Paraclostridium sordellii TaxID=1505 RepID=UPI0005E923C3|nr:SH3 domain-containing protein [Paeniclostridium sordellii]MCQ4696607.1 SH3 domain-containing protein [Paeniclostridium sordellii]CEN84039.1 enterotoxin [[Clostridium] sordellii] [Paeniclostridium sordellii]CEO09896.1 enterotoxin [[Clostridium] sordellii] [Paeniclostridium sordellii]
MNKQFNIFKKGILKTVLAFSFVGISTVGAYAAENATTTTDLNMRENKSTNSKVITIIPEGSNVNILDFDGYWYKVEYNGKEGYSYKKFIKEYKTQDNNFNLKLKVNVDKGSNLNIRSGPSTNYKIVGKATNGQLLKATEKIRNWYKIDYNGQIAYINENFVQILNSKNENNTTNKDTVVIAKDSGIVVVSELNVRTGPSTNYSIISQVRNGDILNIVAKDSSTNWLKIQFKDGTTGWVSGKYVKPTKDNSIVDKDKFSNNSNIETASESVEVNASELNVRSGPGTNYPAITQVKIYDTLDVVAKNIDNGWLKIQLKNGSTGWISGRYVTIATNDTVNITNKDIHVADGPAQVTVSELNVRSGPGTNYSVISQVKKGNILAVIAVNTSNNWLKIQFKDGTTGWVSGKYVTVPDLEELNLDINDPIFK